MKKMVFASVPRLMALICLQLSGLGRIQAQNAILIN